MTCSWHYTHPICSFCGMQTQAYEKSYDVLLFMYVAALEWLRNQDASRDLLVALHPPYTLILWNADTGTRLWKKSYTETILSFSFDPFNSKNIACELLTLIALLVIEFYLHHQTSTLLFKQMINHKPFLFKERERECERE